MEAMSVSTKELQDNWASIRRILTIRNEREYDQAVKRLNGLLDEIGTDERHPLYGLLDTLGTIIHAYEEEHFKDEDVSGTEMLRFLMEEHGLNESDLKEVGSRRVVSDILRGKRELNASQIRTLATRFHVSPAVFV
jgi:HTH-type transcriptional regulator/antitoxin HigA